MKRQYLSGIFILIAVVSGLERKFPDEFRFGVSTASYQVEGAWNVSGKGENIWDYLTHKYPSHVKDLSNGDDACNSYYNYKRDVEMIKSLGMDFYRFSISWSRILPTGFANEINDDGIRYYNTLINELLDKGIEPIITLYHWDLPQPLQVIGGWTNPYVADYFVDYARIVFDNFADRVKTWVTFNEPYAICERGYGAEGRSGFADYLCSKTLLLAHARTYRTYHANYNPYYTGQIGMTNALVWVEPATNSLEDIEAAEIMRNFVIPWFIDPVYYGDYPELMRKIVNENSKQQGYSRSRLPEFTDQEKILLKGTSDFIGVNHYTTTLIKSGYTGPSARFTIDVPVTELKNPKWKHSKSSTWLSIYPDGFRAALNWLRKRYNNQEIMIFENGFATAPSSSRNDDDRVDFFRAYWDVLLDAILIDGCNVTAYAAWSLMDNFEWHDGYTSRFGLYEVDFDSPEKTRRERKSAKVYREMVRTKVIDYNYNPSVDD